MHFGGKLQIKFVIESEHKSNNKKMFFFSAVQWTTVKWTSKRRSTRKELSKPSRAEEYFPIYEYEYEIKSNKTPTKWMKKIEMHEENENKRDNTNANIIGAFKQFKSFCFCISFFVCCNEQQITIEINKNCWKLVCCFYRLKTKTKKLYYQLFYHWIDPCIFKYFVGVPRTP